MPLNAPAEDWAALDRALGDFAASGCVEVREDGQWLAERASLQWEVNRKGKQALVHLWSDERNLTRRVLRVKECAEDRIVLEVQRFGRAKPGRLEFLRTDSPRAAGRIEREQFRARFERILKERFPDAVVDSLTAAPGLEHSFSGLYVRGVMHEGSRAWGVLAVSASEDAAAVEGILAFGILWLDWLRSHVQQRAIEGLRLFVPQGGSRCLRERLLALSSAARTEIYELREPDGMMQKVDSADAGNLESRLMPRREIESKLRAAADTIAEICAMLHDTSSAIALRVLAGKDDLGLSFRGLVFAHWTKQGVFFGLGQAPERLTSATKPRLERLRHQLDLHRSSLAEDANHYL